MVATATTRFSLGPPSTLQAEVVRTRLLALLDSRFDRSVTSVVAGAGFGKTTLLAQAVRRNLAGPIGIDAWVSCQPDDQDAASFVTACCRATGAEPSGAVPRSRDVLTALRNLAPIDVCLVIDDVHELVGSESEGVLAEVTRHLPRNGHLVLSGRAPLDVPLARLRVNGRCLDLGQDELAFTPEEERALAHLLDAPLPDTSLAGWPALLRLALMWRPAAAYEFLWEEIVDALPATLRPALLTLALVGWADAAMISAICGVPIDPLDFAARVPLVSLSEGGILRAHDLWTESLDRLYPLGQIRALLPKICAALEVRHDPLRLAAVATRFGDLRTIRIASRELVRHTIASLPVRRARALLAAAADDPGSPELLLLRAALAHAAAIDDPSIDGLVANATASFAASGDELGEIAALVLAGQVASSRGAYAHFLHIAGRVAQLPGARGELSLNVVSQVVAATLAEMNGDLDRALDAMAKLPPFDTSFPMKEPAARLYVYLLVVAGRANEAVPIADAVLRESSHAHVRRTAPFVRWSAGDPSEIDTLRSTAREAFETNARDRFFHAALATHVHASTGDVDKLRALADQLDAMPLNQADVRDASMLAAAGAVRLVALHDEAGAAKLLREHLERHPVGDRRCDIHLRRALATVYVCAPAVRPAWDCARLGSCHRRMHAAATALLAARGEVSAGPPASGSIDEAISRTLEDTEALITMVPLPFAVELAVRAHARGLSAGRRGLEALRHRFPDQVSAEMRWQQCHGDELVQRCIPDLLDTRPSGDGRRVRIRVLGPTRVLVEGRTAENTSSRRIRVRQLLALLTVEPRLRRDRAMALLWPDLDQTAASRNLRVTLTYLRQLFRELRPGRSNIGTHVDDRFLTVDSTTIHLVAHPDLEVDLWQLDKCVAGAARARAAGDLTAHVAALSTIESLWQGEPLIDLLGLEELSGAVTRVHAALIESTLALGEIRLTEGRGADAVRHAETVLAADPYIERAHRLAIAAQIHLGNHRAARDAARRMEAALAEVGAEPSDATQILLRRIAALDASRAPPAG
jgi:DNA-binding SARP family transcriptional activator